MKYSFVIYAVTYKSLNSLRPSDAYMRQLIIIDLDKGLLPGRRQAIIWTNAEILLIWTRGTNFCEIVSKIRPFSLKKCIWKHCLRNHGNFVLASIRYDSDNYWYTGMKIGQPHIDTSLFG